MIKRNTLTSIVIVALFSIFILAQSSCKKDDDDTTGTADFKVSLKSTSSSRSTYDSINIDIQKISIHTSTDTASTSGWFELETNVGIYDLLDYSSGNDTILALDSLLEVQTISQIRLILGSNNTIVDDGVSYELETPSGQTSGIKVQIHTELQPNMTYKVVLDFDPDASINKTGNGTYKLKPVINATVVVL